MTPHLTRRGQLVLAAGALVLLAGALRASPPLAGLGGLVLAALSTAYIAFYPTAVLLRRRRIELSWWAPPGDQPGGALAADRPFVLRIAYRNHGARTLRVLHTRVLTGRALAADDDVPATVGPGMQVEVTTTIRPRAAGYQLLHGAVLVFGDVLGLFDVEAYFPNPLAVKVFPRARPAIAPPATAAAVAAHERAGLHVVRRRGSSGELRELRDHVPGDPFKFVAWKATARRGRLMVRELDSEIVAAHALAVDVGGAMRDGPIGRAPLDWALDAAAAIARAALERGDRVSLTTWDTRVVAELRAGAGHHHWLQLVDRLLDARSIVDEDLVALTSDELVTTVARYLANQESFDARAARAPALDDLDRWQAVHPGADGQLYDVGAMTRLIEKLLAAGRTRKAVTPSWWERDGADRDPALAMLRRFCRVRGLELPYRHDATPAARAAGLEAALERAVADGRPDTVVVVSDLAGLAVPEAALARAVGRARRRAGAVVVLAPPPPPLLAEARTPIGRQLAEVILTARAANLTAARQLLARHGATVVEAGAADHPATLLERAARRRAA
jgi:uncharacterized protein (DUF58 family)